MPPVSYDLVIDGIIGYSLKGSPKAGAAKLIDWANAQRAPVLSLDVPSGLDLTDGENYEPTVQAAATLTLALPKEGLFMGSSSRFVGELYLADISVPPQLYADTSLDIRVGPIFSQGNILQIQTLALTNLPISCSYTVLDSKNLILLEIRWISSMSNCLRFLTLLALLSLSFLIHQAES